MNVPVKASIVLAVIVGLVSVASFLTGLHENYLIGGIGGTLLAILINIGVIFWALRQTAADTGYGGQLLNSLLVGLLGGVLIFLSSWLLLSVVFPDALAEAGQGALDFMADQGMSEAQMEQAAAGIESATPAKQSLAGLIGTFVTSLVSGAIVAIFQRRK